MQKRIAIKIDVDTDRGTRIGVPNLLQVFNELQIPATFLFSLGPDNTGRAIKRIFRPGFLKKVSRSGVLSTYGLRTLMNGVLLPGPHIGKKNQAILKQVSDAGFEVGIHCYDHIRWQDGLKNMSEKEVKAEFQKARNEFERIFTNHAKTAGAAGWQANEFSLAAYDEANLFYASDARGSCPFFPRVGDRVFKTLQVPTTLPTLDELLGRPEYPLSSLTEFYINLLEDKITNTFTIHAEIEGMKYFAWFKDFLKEAKRHNIAFITQETLARECLSKPESIPICDFIQAEIDGRSGTLAYQKSLS